MEKSIKLMVIGKKLSLIMEKQTKLIQQGSVSDKSLNTHNKMQRRLEIRTIIVFLASLRMLMMPPLRKHIKRQLATGIQIDTVKPMKRQKLKLRKSLKRSMKLWLSSQTLKSENNTIWE